MLTDIGLPAKQSAMTRKIHEQGAQLTTADRLALADKVRSQSPQLHDIDVVKLIREDRDAR